MGAETEVNVLKDTLQTRENEELNVIMISVISKHKNVNGLYSSRLWCELKI